VEALLDGLAVVASVLMVSLPCPSAAAEADVMAALETLGVSMSTLLGIGAWAAISLLSAGAWLSTTTDTALSADSGWHLMR
jgi:hypothetical protein